MSKVILFVITLFILGCSKPTNKIVAIQTLNGFPSELTDSVQTAIENYYHFNTVVFDDIKIPQQFYTSIKSPRYRADSIIHYLRDIKPDSINHIIGLTTKDISTTKKDGNGNIKKPEYKYKDWGIFGLGFRPGPSCIVSNYRIKINNKQQYIERLQKIVVHELGHNLGLPHCENQNCFSVMLPKLLKRLMKLNSIYVKFVLIK